MTYNTIEKALSDCDAESFNTDTHKSVCATGTLRGEAIATLVHGFFLPGFVFRKYRCTYYVRDVHAQQASSCGVGGRK